MMELRLHKTRIIFGPFGDLKRFIKGRRTFLIVDEHISELYKEKFPDFKVLILESGEKTKNLKTVERIYRSLLKMECDRFSIIVGLGGGVVCDITGFVASTFLRGVSFGLIPTTLLAQVDASIGGKNGVNFQGYKNIIGTINQPEFVIIDPSFLETLPERERRNGFAELIKHAIIANKVLFSLLEKKEKGLLFEGETLKRILYESIKVKVSIVRKDEKEKDERRKLNFGHTFGHAIESVYLLPHGEAVSIGMAKEAKLSLDKGLLKEKDYERILSILKKFDLPTEIESDKRWLKAIKKDKKRDGSYIYTVLVERIGKVRIERMEMKEIEDAFLHMC